MTGRDGPATEALAWQLARSTTVDYARWIEWIRTIEGVGYTIVQQAEASGPAAPLTPESGFMIGDHGVATGGNLVPAASLTVEALAAAWRQHRQHDHAGGCGVRCAGRERRSDAARNAAAMRWQSKEDRPAAFMGFRQRGGRRLTEADVLADIRRQHDEAFEITKQVAQGKPEGRSQSDP